MGNHTVETNDQNFKASVLDFNQPVLVDFWAPWCGPCLSIAPALEELAETYTGKVRIAKMNVDENPHTPAQYGVRSIPYLVLFKDGKIVDSIVGAVPKTKLSQLLDRAALA